MPSDNSYYDDAPAAPGQAPEGKAEPDAAAGDEAKTAIIPKSIFGSDLKPGDKCDIEVTAVHEDSYEVKGCEGHDEKEPEPSGGDESEPPAQASPMSAMLSD